MAALPQGTPDAVLIPRDYSSISKPRTMDNHLALKKEFGPVLGSQMVHAHLCYGMTMFLLTGTTGPKTGGHWTPVFPVGHPRAGEDRYVWVERTPGEGVMYGYLKPDDHKVVPVPQAIAESLSAAREAFLESDEGKAWLAQRSAAASA